MTEMFGVDKEEAMRCIDNDSQFDSWLQRYNAKMKAQSKGSGNKNHVTRQEFENRTKGMLPNPGRD